MRFVTFCMREMDQGTASNFLMVNSISEQINVVLLCIKTNILSFSNILAPKNQPKKTELLN